MLPRVDAVHDGKHVILVAARGRLRSTAEARSVGARQVCALRLRRPVRSPGAKRRATDGAGAARPADARFAFIAEEGLAGRQSCLTTFSSQKMR